RRGGRAGSPPPPPPPRPPCPAPPLSRGLRRGWGSPSCRGGCPPGLAPRARCCPAVFFAEPSVSFDLPSEARRAQPLLCNARRALAQRVESSDVLTDQIRLQVDARPHALAPERSAMLRFRDDCHAEVIGAYLVDGEADPVHCRRALLDEKWRQRPGEGKAHQPRAALLASIQHLCHRVHVPGDQMASKPIAELHRALEIDGVLCTQLAERAAPKGLR